MDELVALRRHLVVLLVAPSGACVEVLVRCLLAVRAVPVRAGDGRHAQALLDALDIDLVVADARAFDADPGLDRAVGAADVPLVLVGEPSGEVPASAVAPLPESLEPFEIALEVQRLAAALTDDVLRWGPLTLDVRRRACVWQGRPVRLSPTQFRLLAALVLARGGVVSRADLCRRSLGSYLPGDAERLDAHLRRIRKLLADDDAAQEAFLLTVRGEGVRLADPCVAAPAALAAVPQQVGVGS